MSSPVIADIQSTVVGFPSIRIVFARDRSARVNHRVSRCSITGKIRLSATPSKNRSSASTQKTRITPVSAASSPHVASAPHTALLTLYLRAKIVPGI
jgi:hypothetical protein